MGSIFPRVITTVILVCLPIQAIGQILLPEEPTTQLPPQRDKKMKQQDDLERKQALDQKREEAGIKTAPKEEPASLKLDRALLEETLKPKMLDYALLLHLVYPKILTSGSERTGYDAEPNAGLGFIYKIGKKDHHDGASLWIGGRAQFFGGTGSYQGTQGRYSFLYFGPTIGIGKISPGPADVPAGTEESSASIAKALTSRHAFFAFAGIAGQSRSGIYDRDQDTPKDDLDTKAVAFDSPGLFAEFYYANIRYNAFSYNGVLGTQMGKGKLFMYMGLGIGLWN